MPRPDPRSVILALLWLAGATTLAAAQAAPRLSWWVVAGGGNAESSGLRLDASLGQSLAGSASGDALRLDAGFWPGPMPIPSTTPGARPSATAAVAPTATATLSPTAAEPTGTRGTPIAPSQTPEPTPTPEPAAFLPRLLR